MNATATDLREPVSKRHPSAVSAKRLAVTLRVVRPVLGCFVVILLWLGGDHTFACQTQAEPDSRQLEKSIQRVGVNNNESLKESSGLAASSVPDAYWTINDSGNSSDIALLSSQGKLLATHTTDAKNIDWEAMASVVVDQQRWLVIADVGDNLLRRSELQLYVLPEPESPLTPGKKPLKTRVVRFSYDAKGTTEADKNRFAETRKKPVLLGTRPANCEAIGVDPTSLQVWLVEKVYLTAQQTTPPGVFVLQMPKSIFESTSSDASRAPSKVRVAKRQGSFPVKNVTGMAFSPDGKHLLIRNYLNAHLYRRSGDEVWLETFASTRPDRVVLPLQRQGEAVCFSSNSKNVILTSELLGQPIWKVNLQWYLDQPVRKRPR